MTVIRFSTGMRQWCKALIGACLAIMTGVFALALVIMVLPIAAYSTVSYLLHRGR